MIFAFEEDPEEAADGADELAVAGPEPVGELELLPAASEAEGGVVVVVAPGAEPAESAVVEEGAELLADGVEDEAGALGDANPEKAVATSEEDR